MILSARRRPFRSMYSTSRGAAARHSIAKEYGAVAHDYPLRMGLDQVPVEDAACWRIAADPRPSWPGGYQNHVGCAMNDGAAGTSYIIIGVGPRDLGHYPNQVRPNGAQSRDGVLTRHPTDSYPDRSRLALDSSRLSA